MFMHNDAQNDFEKMPGYTLLELMGKSVIRPGGLKLTRLMIEKLQITEKSKIIEINPGKGKVTDMILKYNPEHYIAIERNEKFIDSVKKKVAGYSSDVVLGNPSETELNDNISSILVGEALLTNRSDKERIDILTEANRILKPKGLYALHEVVVNENTSDGLKKEIRINLTKTLKVNAKPLSKKEWYSILEENNFEVLESFEDEIKLLSPRSMISDEGIGGMRKILFNLIKNKTARNRARAIRSIFKEYKPYLNAIVVIAKNK